MKPAAIIFDLDGTLLDTLADIASAMNQVLISHDLPTHTAESYRLLVGEGIEQLVAKAIPQHLQTNMDVAALVAEYRAAYRQCWRENSQPYPGIPELLGALTARQIRCAVLSNKAHQFTEIMARELLPGFHFDVILGASERFAKKPDPQAAWHIAKEIGIAPQHFFFIGDSEIDIQTGLAAGMTAVGVLWGFRSVQELQAAGAHILLKKPCELLDYLVP